MTVHPIPIGVFLPFGIGGKSISIVFTVRFQSH